MKNKKKKILFIGPFDRGGISTVNRQVIDLVAATGDFEWKTINTTPWRDRGKLAGYLVLYAIAFFRLLAFRSDIVYLQISQTGFLHQSLFLLIAKIFNCRTLAHFHAKPGVSTTLPPGKFKHILAAQRYIDELIVLAESSKSDLEKCGWKNPIHVIPNFVDASIFPENTDPVDRREYILYLGRMSEMKGIFGILDVAVLTPEHKYVFIGPFEDKQTQQRFVDRSIDLVNVRWLGPIYGNEKIDCLKRAKILIFPSATEVFPMTIIECSMCGVIPLATPVGLIGNLIQDGKNGFLIDAGTPERTAAIIRALAEDPARARAISDNGRREVREKYTQSVIGPRLLEIIDRN